MDYKAIFPIPVAWSADQFNEFNMPEPYDRLHRGTLMELEAANYPTQFLLILHDLNENTGIFTSFAIEAPHDCPMRHAFEWGEISWMEFWSHRGWLLQVEYPIAQGPAAVKYITPEQLPNAVTNQFKSFGNRGPYHLKLEHLERIIENAPNSRHGPEHQRAYRDFILKHGHKLYKKAVA